MVNLIKRLFCYLIGHKKFKWVEGDDKYYLLTFEGYKTRVNMEFCGRCKNLYCHGIGEDLSQETTGIDVNMNPEKVT